MKTTILKAAMATGLTMTLGASTLAQAASRARVDTADLAAKAVAHLGARSARVDLPEETSFRARNVLSDDIGQAHVRVDQLYRGVPVIEGDAAKADA